MLDSWFADMMRRIVENAEREMHDGRVSPEPYCCYCNDRHKEVTAR